MKQLARLVTTKVGGKDVAGLTDCGLNLTTEFATSQTKEDVTPVDEAMRVAWEISISGELGHEDTSKADISTMKSAVKAGTKLQVQYVIGSLASYSGTAIISSYQETMPTDGKVTYSATLTGVSSLTKGAASVAVNETGEAVAAYDPETATTNEEE